MNKEQDVYIFTIKSIDGVNHFFVEFSDINCITHKVELSEEVYNELLFFKKLEKRQQNHYERHIEFRVLSDIELHKRAQDKPELTDEQILRKSDSDALYAAIDKLTRKQRNRVILHVEHGLSQVEIARVENCSVNTIRESLRNAKKKIRKYLQKDSD